MRKLDQKTVIERFKKAHGDLYDYSLVEYKNKRTNVDVICRKHGVFKTPPMTHAAGHGCRKCYDDRSVERLRAYNTTRVEKAATSFINRAKKVHAGKGYDYSLLKYKKGKGKITVICPEHGKFYPTANNHLAGQMCPSCSESGFNPQKPAIVYYIRIDNGDGEYLYKIGITNKTVQERYRVNVDRNKIKVLKIWDFLLGSDAQEKEFKIKKIYKKFLYKGKSPLVLAGITEIFTYDILGLDRKNVDGRALWGV